MKLKSSSFNWVWLFEIIGIAIVYLLAAKLAMLFATPEKVSPVWPPAGITLAAVLIRGYRIWPGIMIGALLEPYTQGLSVHIIIGVGIANTLNPLIAAYFLDKFKVTGRIFDRTGDTFKFIIFGAMISTGISSFIGAFTLCSGNLVPWTSLFNTWWVWWLSDVVGVYIITPLIVVWAKFPRFRLSIKRLPESFALLLIVMIVCSLVFLKSYQLLYLFIPILVWAAFRFQQHLTTSILLIVSGIAVWSMAQKLGVLHGVTITESLLRLFAFITAVSITTLLLSAVIAERKNAELQLKKANITLEQKVDIRTQELNESLEKVESANKKVLDSIKYAQKIQNSLLPNQETIKQILPENFIIWTPRDIVGGDIYFIDSCKEGVTVMMIDCTGHGVPGALMTMVVSSALKRIVIDEECHEPAEILRQMSALIKAGFYHEAEDAIFDNGLDAAICFISEKEKTLTFSGANLPLTYISKDSLQVIKGDRQSLGYQRSDPEYKFSSHTIALKEDIQFYLYSDGIIDQMGGEKQFSFGQRKFSDLLQANSHLNFQEQKDAIYRAFVSYTGKNEVQDDITVIGFKANC